MKLRMPKAETVRLIAIALVLAGIVHICVTFAMPGLTGSSAFKQFSTSLPPNKMSVLPTVTPEAQPLPFMGPDARYAVCRFDTSTGPVAVNLTLPDAGWIMAIYNAEGDNFYHVSGQAGRRIPVALLLVPPSEQPLIGPSAEALPTAVAPGSGAPVPVPARQGIVMLRAPERGLAYRQDTEAELRKARCDIRKMGSPG